MNRSNERSMRSQTYMLVTDSSDQVVGILERMPEKTFNLPEDIKNTFGNLKNLGNLGGFKL